MGNTPSTSQNHPPKPTTLTNIQLIRKLEDPHYGEIRLVRDGKTGEQIFLKEILFPNNEAYQAELIFYNKRIAVSHPNVVRILGCTGKERPAFSSGYNKIMVFIEVLTKTLAEEINVRLQTGIPFSENDILIVAENLIAGLSYFETQNIFHGDIRPENIFATTHSYKLSDPYLNEQKNANALYHAILGTARTLLSPQLLIQVPRQNFNIECNKFKADVFSLGAVLLSMASLTSSEDLYDYERGLLDLDSLRERLDIVRRSYSKFTYEMIKNMLKIKEEERPDFITLANRLLPYQEDIRRKIDLSFFGVRAPSEEINHDGEEFFAKAYAELQEKIKLDSQAYLDEPETTRVKSSQPPTSRNINEDYDQQLPSTSRNLSTSNLDDIPAYAEVEHSSYIASIHSGRFEGQLPIKHKAHGQIFGKVDRPRMSPGANLNVDGAPAQVKQKGPQQKSTQYQNENQEQTMTPRQMAVQPQSQRQQLQQSQEKLVQQRQLQLQQSQAKGQRPPQQFQQQQMQVQPQSQIHYPQEQQGQLSQRQYQAQPQVQKLQYESPQKWQTGQGSSQGQMPALVTRQMNVEPESNLNPRSPFGKQKSPSVNAQVQFEPHHPHQTSSHFHHTQSHPPDYATLQKQNIPSIQPQIQPQIQVQGIAESLQPQAPKDIVYDDLEAKIRAALQRSETTYQMASKNNLETKPMVSQDKETRDILTEASVIPPLNAYKSSNYGYYEVPMSDGGRFSPSEKTGETEDIINTLNLAKMEPSALPISDFLKENDRSQFYNYGQQINQYGGVQGYFNYGTKFNQQEELDFIRYGTEGETDYNYHYGTGGDRFTVKKQGQTIVLHE